MHARRARQTLTTLITAALFGAMHPAPLEAQETIFAAPKAMESERVFSSFRTVTVLPLGVQSARVEFIAAERRVVLERLDPLVADELIARAKASPHVGHLATLDGAVHIWLRSMRTSVAQVVGRRGAPSQLVLGERRFRQAPRAMFLGAQCQLSYAELDEPVFARIADRFCAGVANDDDVETLNERLVLLEGEARQLGELLLLDLKEAPEYQHRRLLERYPESGRLHAHVWLSIAMQRLWSDDLEGALLQLEQGEIERRRAQIRWSPERRLALDELGRGVWARLVRGSLVRGEDAKAVARYDAYQRWEGPGEFELRRDIAHAMRRIGKLMKAAGVYRKMLRMRPISRAQSRMVMGELATTYLEADHAYLAWATLRYASETFGAEPLKPEFDALVRWIEQRRICPTDERGPICEGLTKPGMGDPLDLMHRSPDALGYEPAAVVQTTFVIEAASK